MDRQVVTPSYYLMQPNILLEHKTIAYLSREWSRFTHICKSCMPREELVPVKTKCKVLSHSYCQPVNKNKIRQPTLDCVIFGTFSEGKFFTKCIHLQNVKVSLCRKCEWKLCLFLLYKCNF